MLGIVKTFSFNNWKPTSVSNNDNIPVHEPFLKRPPLLFGETAKFMLE